MRRKKNAYGTLGYMLGCYGGHMGLSSRKMETQMEKMTENEMETPSAVAQELPKP